MKKTFYFSHDYNSRDDEKIQNLIYKLGYEGYGLFWAIIEMLYQNDGYLKMDFERIAFILRTQCDTLKSVISDFDLFKFNDKNFYSQSILNRLKERKLKSKKAKESAESRWNKVKEDNANALQDECDSNAIKERKGKENKLKENKEKYNLIYNEIVKYFDEKFIDEYNYYECIRLLIENDKRDKNELISVIKYARNNEFWSKNFMSIVKLRKKNKEDIMYYDVFFAQMKMNKKSNSPEFYFP